MAEIFGTEGERIEVSGEYECSECGHREHFDKDGAFPRNHHPSKPWMLYLKDDS